MLLRSIAFVVWVAVAASAVFWASHLFARPRSAPAQTVVAAPSTALRGDLVRLFGPDPVRQEAAAAEEPDVGDRFQLIGVVAPRGGGRQGVALIAVDGLAPRAVRVGAVVDGDLVLRKVEPRAAEVGPRDGGSATRLELPALPPPASGSLPAAAAPVKPVQPGRPPARPQVTTPAAMPLPGAPFVRPPAPGAAAPAMVAPTMAPFRAPEMPTPQPQPRALPQAAPAAAPAGTDAAEEGQGPVTR